MRVLVTGGGGQLATDLVHVLAFHPQHTVVAPGRGSLDVADRDAVRAAFGEVDPDVVFHTAAWTAVDACESDVDRAFKVNALGTRHVAEGARGNGAHVVYVSTDYVFDGRCERPYTEWDVTAPQSVYGRSKLAGEHELLAQLPGATVVRTAWVCGRHGDNMVKTILRLASKATTLRFVDDQWGCPTFTDDLAGALYEMGVGRRPGVFHVTNQGPTTWYRFATDVVALAGADPAMVLPIRTDELVPPRPAPRPANSVLDNAALRLSGLPLLADHHEPLKRTVKALVAGH
ncbi:MAG: dTDP-4-dehydrorhamnose reductase [Actinomycetota bacterium]|nr:dTDP-4-dehydrorhamnose reductase [Actinomycetota bacterium]